MENVIDMFGIPILKSRYCDVMDNGIQYKVDEWYLEDVKKYTNQFAVIGYDGSLKIYEKEGDLLFEGTLLDSNDFVQKMKERLR